MRRLNKFTGRDLWLIVGTILYVTIVGKIIFNIIKSGGRFVWTSVFGILLLYIIWMGLCIWLSVIPEAIVENLKFPDKIERKSGFGLLWKGGLLILASVVIFNLPLFNKYIIITYGFFFTGIAAIAVGIGVLLFGSVSYALVAILLMIFFGGIGWYIWFLIHHRP